MDININKKEQEVVSIIRIAGKVQSSDVHNEMIKRGEDLSLVSVKRMLSLLESQGVLKIQGTGRGTAYTLSEYGKLMTPVEAELYNAIDPDRRYGSKNYDFDLFPSISFEPFNDEEIEIMDEATKYYRDKSIGVSETIHKKELERFIIELSWKSSKIEGNTYTLLDTEALILRGQKAVGHSEEESRMIVNHKNAFTYIFENSSLFKDLKISNIEAVHSILVEGLNVQNNFRAKPVGIAGSIYRPLDNPFQIREAVLALSETVARLKSGYSKALITLLGLSYIQPFEDGNKRTARLTTNAVLLAHGLSPISYRSVDERTYREAVLVFYELNSLVPMKKIFIEQYDFAARNYLLG